MSIWSTYRVKHPEYGEAEVVADGKRSAISEICMKYWGVDPRSAGPECLVERVKPKKKSKKARPRQ